jgi:RecA/RadA recombinase
MLPQPLGPDCDVLFVDGGNNFDPYAISDSSVTQSLDAESVLERLHVSRAFTHHQLACIITDKLSLAIRKFGAKFVVVSNITALFCDSDIRDDDKEDALRIFAKTARALRMLARQHSCIIVASNIELRSSLMDHVLKRAAHVSLSVEQKTGLTKFSLLKHLHLPPSTITFASDAKTLESYM